MTPSAASSLCLVTPVFNDWGALRQLLGDLETALHAANVHLDVVVVNDGSASNDEILIETDPSWTTIKDVSRIDLHANVGHQLAIATGLQYVQRHRKFDAVLIMDADGEDRPLDTLKLIKVWQETGSTLVVAERTKRSESLSFKIFYRTYRYIFRILTGQNISFGNFSLIPASLLPEILSRPEIVHHFAATLLRTRLPITYVPTVRGQRYAGHSRMTMPTMVLHAVAALSVFSDVLFSRLLIAAAFIGVACGAGTIFVAALRLFTPYAFPNWATTVISFLTLLAAQAVVLILCTGFLLLTNRTSLLLTSIEVGRLVKEVHAGAEPPDADQ
jgi:hypothetical protein